MSILTTTETVSLFHYHDDHHHDVTHLDDGDDDSGLFAVNHHDDHHEGHFHPLFSMFVMEQRVNVGLPQPEAHPPGPVQSFSSHIPPLFDRPPLALR